MPSTPYDSMRDAVRAANVGRDAEFDFVEQTSVVGPVSIKQLHVNYKSGNEYLRIDKLIGSLSESGDLELCEYRGRGGDDGQLRLVCDVKYDGERYQLIYHIG